ncbi:transmembrane protein, putative (macronuclear) [Tetrahymena thermophila SB210]|uniref:Transmembrane protein, putative n=1 Tax=Tetrahymena thermophila (strain SB210) TaxID=312017 RepID=W7X752_TETTS|nr:transmembrane protein, putative [Tetrahymena thermophila SB210]EWS72223.1 transmembrane protein, putative [Tetrahymena thermophila SB210]|eukprot:XP_012655240.1 transmembrane protein, putative [Tetrahymena thermophila SB210]
MTFQYDEILVKFVYLIIMISNQLNYIFQVRQFTMYHQLQVYCTLINSFNYYFISIIILRVCIYIYPIHYWGHNLFVLKICVSWQVEKLIVHHYRVGKSKYLNSQIRLHWSLYLGNIEFCLSRDDAILSMLNYDLVSSLFKIDFMNYS